MKKLFQIAWLMAMAVSLCSVTWGQQQAGIAYTKTGAVTATSASCTATACVFMPVPSQTSAVGVQVTGTFVATLQFEASVDGVTFVGVAAVPPGTTASRT